ncbi:MAG: 3-isopropylmalate dehydratase small subunit [Candidatus Bathyarchaeota archaeon]|nr:3-isopropylmalate dehydratase small subunit [Candidatus Bathyarchaeum tardum]WGM89900.1 MAG: 3-isopropylmalate dehydratase small subunit [Candidatus Bathyarchaeum tardum]WNZ29939.1 MAG: 3-isopropylmalate dehydratase small subunit [Candidatus Bathyarchaeota archaeon]
MAINGKAIKFGDNIDTDVILPGPYLVHTNPYELAKHAMEGLDSEFPQKASGGVIVVGAKNFGCGSSREQAPIALKYAGVKCVLAESFARIFYRNAITIGLPVLVCKDVSTKVNEGDELTVNLQTGKVENLTNGAVLQATKLPEFIMGILDDGGLIKHLKRSIKQ